MKPTPELQLLLLTCAFGESTERATQIRRFIQTESLDWPRVIALAERHRLTPFLYYWLRSESDIPAEIVGKLHNECRVIAADNLLKHHHYQTVKQFFNAHGIDHWPLKGIFLAHDVYPESSLRPTGDLDLVINHDDVIRCVTLLRQEGYHLNRKQSLYWQRSPRSVLTDWWEMSLFKPFSAGSQFDIDLHWGVAHIDHHYHLFKLPDLCRDPALLIEQQIVLLVVHHGVNNVWQHIFYLNDLYFLLQKTDLNWFWLLNELRQHDIDRVFLTGLNLCQRYWSLTLPDALLTDVRHERIQVMATACERRWDNPPVSLSRLVLVKLFFFLNAQTRFTRQLRALRTFVVSRIFVPSTFLVGNRMVYVPKELGFLSVIGRGFRSLYRLLVPPAKPV
ncbi:nucleotidyltransferase family protein [Spirosoma montaniterrae]|uniref:Nucleotidyltransferase n=1 Tax=Spirosoma montaniterrae TaxID=1178516 RepID=A0A1P9WS75_9BACT|nr:nucleotidyltransferase family protein [Spirosoma montaniterrae]AQG78238.1 hypothetical protein AWR27_02080 [Spirosoma montaniterrae]